MSFWKPGTDGPSKGREKEIEKEKTVRDSSATKGKGNEAEKPIALSKGVMGMKFMKEKEKYTEKSSYLNFSKQLDSLEVPRQATDALECSEDSFDFIATLPGRRSFNGCNKAVERYYEQRLDDLKFRKKADSVTHTETVSDQEMIKRYENLIGLPRGPSQGKRPEFIKNKTSSSNDHQKGHGNKKFSNESCKRNRDETVQQGSKKRK
jgi:hypothetical protein